MAYVHNEVSELNRTQPTVEQSQRHAQSTLNTNIDPLVVHVAKLEVDGKPVRDASARACSDGRTTRKHNVSSPVYRMDGGITTSGVSLLPTGSAAL